jgi:hypothetical protein
MPAQSALAEQMDEPLPSSNARAGWMAYLLRDLRDGEITSESLAELLSRTT